jgi:acetoin utilization protein AcuB
MVRGVLRGDGKLTTLLTAPIGYPNAVLASLYKVLTTVCNTMGLRLSHFNDPKYGGDARERLKRRVCARDRGGEGAARIRARDAGRASTAGGGVRLAGRGAFMSTLERDSGLHYHQFPTVREYMTPSPLTIGRAQTLSTAQRKMREHAIHHLPVLDGGQIVGLLSERDILLVESLPGTNPTDVRAEEAMVQSVLTTAPDAPLAEVVETMLARKVGSAVVMDGERVVGVFTTVDALRALLDRLSVEE